MVAISAYRNQYVWISIIQATPVVYLDNISSHFRLDQVPCMADHSPEGYRLKERDRSSCPKVNFETVKASWFYSSDALHVVQASKD